MSAARPYLGAAAWAVVIVLLVLLLVQVDVLGRRVAYICGRESGMIAAPGTLSRIAPTPGATIDMYQPATDRFKARSVDFDACD